METRHPCPDVFSGALGKCGPIADRPYHWLDLAFVGETYFY